MKKYAWLICLLLLSSCNVIREESAVDEDYERLFPPKEIEKPENKRGQLVVQPCDPHLALENYKYPGTELPTDADTYRVTLTCQFNELDKEGKLVDASEVTARYEVKYINEKKELITITCKRKTYESAGEMEQANEASGLSMTNGREWKQTFTVRSGFPMYLSVSGIGPTNSNVKATIKAVSTDELVEIPELKTEQYQNEEGPNVLRYPYCEYMILP